METLLSPKQVAQALRVSESSVKRWCDKGSIVTTYTEGGHRRIRMGDLAEFVRANRLGVHDFVPMGLVPTLPAQVDGQIACDQVLQAMLEGDEDRCSNLVLEMYLAKLPIHRICDSVIARALHRIGEEWACGTAAIYQERLSCKVIQRVLHRLQMLVPEVPDKAPTALGCSAEGDPYSLGTTMVELVLRESGWRAFSLGENIPLEDLANAIERHQPHIVWLSCSCISDSKSFVDRFQILYDRFHASGVLFAIGGQALTSDLIDKIPHDLHGTTMKDIYEFALRVRSSFRSGRVI